MATEEGRPYRGERRREREDVRTRTKGRPTRSSVEGMSGRLERTAWEVSCIGPGVGWQCGAVERRARLAYGEDRPSNAPPATPTGTARSGAPRFALSSVCARGRVGARWCRAPSRGRRCARGRVGGAGGVSVRPLHRPARGSALGRREGPWWAGCERPFAGKPSAWRARVRRRRERQDLGGSLLQGDGRRQAR